MLQHHSGVLCLLSKVGAMNRSLILYIFFSNRPLHIVAKVNFPTFLFLYYCFPKFKNWQRPFYVNFEGFKSDGSLKSMPFVLVLI